jgi:type II secretory pathway pseudopilin PulG
MRHFKKNTKAISVIVGALMLTLIAVTAATSFSLFVSQQQELRQQSEFASLQRELEQLSILQIQQPTYINVGGGQYHLHSIKFTAHNLYSEDSTITSFLINQNFIKRFSLQRTTGTEEYWQVSTQTGHLRRGSFLTKDTTNEQYLFYDNDNDEKYSSGDLVIDYDYDNNGIPAQPEYGQQKTGDFIYAEYYHPLILPSREQIQITISDVINDVYITQKIWKHNSISIHVYTNLNNYFSKIFYPPVALIQLDLTSTPQICDGTKSHTSSENAYIVLWKWIIYDINMGTEPEPIYGPIIQYEFRTGTIYNIDLEVTDNYGMISNTTYVLET